MSVLNNSVRYVGRGDKIEIRKIGYRDVIQVDFHISSQIGYVVNEGIFRAGQVKIMYESELEEYNYTINTNNNIKLL